MKNLILIGLFFTSCSLSGQNTYTLDSTVLTSRVVKDSLDIPWEIIWGPDDHIWTTERYGRVSRINPKTGTQHAVLDISSAVYEQAEAGMLGMVLHPDFLNKPEVFIAYTYLSNSSIKERLVRYTYNGTKLLPMDTLIENIQGNTTHIGCRLIFLKDNTLLMTTGDAQNQSLPQNASSVVGKILRLNMDGSIPANNPNPSSYIYSIGHRNAQGLWLAPNGIVYSSEHGPTTDDELNIIKADKNYGWPNVAGFCNTPPEQSFCQNTGVTEPLAAWTPTIAPSDIIWYSHPAIPEFNNTLLMTVLKDKSLIAFGFNGTGDSVIAQNKYFKNDFGRLRDICVSPQGNIYLATNGSSWSNNNPFTHSIIELSNASFVGLDQPNKMDQIKLNPNPIAQGEMLKLPQGVSGKFSLYDLSGREVYSVNLSTTPSLNISLDQGVYLWKITTLDGDLSNGKLKVE
ncbi:PQQ-dependent sugar dehydrogenase [Bacteroidia bacterium]|nr:PQQ-dependent sugar dehydrogenase [Bacteroidia bacterium]